MLLAFETVARTASACVSRDDGAVEEAADLAGGEAEIGLVSLLDGLVRRHPAIDRLAVAAGPGSFTGLRIGITAARTLAWLQGWRVHAVDALEARAREAGDGLWWVAVPLKRDTTFHGVFRVAGPHCSAVVPTTACRDDGPPPLPAAVAADPALVAIGPGVTAKADLLARWRPGLRLGAPAGLTARGVACAAAHVPGVAWSACLPAYHQLPAPVLQRAASRPSPAPSGTGA